MKIEFKCKYCNYSAGSIKELKNHMMKEHGIKKHLIDESIIKVYSPDIEVGMSIYFTKMMNTPVKFILDSYNPKQRLFIFYMTVPRLLTFEQTEAFIELRELFYDISRVSMLGENNYIVYPNGHADVIYMVQIKEENVKKLLNSV